MFSYFSSRQGKCLLLLALGWFIAATLCAYGEWKYRPKPLSDKDFLSEARPSSNARPSEAVPASDVPSDKDLVPIEQTDAYRQSALNEYALEIGVLCSIPWLWYFLLRRLAEFSAAIRGHD